MRALLIVSSVTLLAGCYSYSPVTLAAVPEGATVTARLSTRGTVAHEGTLGADVEEIDGVVIRQTPDSIALRVERTRNRRGQSNSWAGEPVTIGSASIDRLQQRSFSKARTAVAAAGVVGLVAVGIGTDLIGKGDDPAPGNPPGGNPTGPTAVRIPIIIRH